MTRLRLRHSQHWRLLQDLPVQSIPMILMLHVGRGVTGMLVASGESSPSVSSRLAPSTHDRPSDPARSSCGVSCPGRASWPALHYHMRADVKIGAVKAQAQKHWRRLQRFELISNVVTGILSLTVKNNPASSLQSRIPEFALCRLRGKLPCLSALQPRFVLTGGCTESQCGSFRYRSSAAGAPLGGNADSNWERKETIRL